MSDADLSHHYKVLKQFLDISDDSNSRAKSNSSRAARAREKLLRLSGAQFRELSTDVYDELRRRIDESRSEPDFLLPKSTFHPKRNQARQKLSSLPQSRFKDLVSDISFEIERRNLHSPVSTSAPPESPSNARSLQDQPPAPRAPTHSRSQSTDVHHQQSTKEEPEAPVHAAVPAKQNSVDAPRDTKPARNSVLSVSSEEAGNLTSNVANSTSLQDDLATPNLRNQVSEKAIGLQPTTVVPTKANMTWSSDEEEEEVGGRENDEDDGNDAGKDYARKINYEEPRQLNLSNAFGVPPRSVDNVPANDSTMVPPNSHVDGTRTGVSDKRSASHPTVKGKSLASVEEFEELKSAYDNLRNEHESLKNAHKDAQARVSQLTTSHADVQAQLTDLQESQQSTERDFGTLNEKHSAVLSKHDDLEALVESLQRENVSLASEKEKLPSLEDYQSLKSELEDLRTSNASLRLENSNLKSSSPKSKKADVSSREVTPRDSNDTTNGLDINAELKKLHEKLDQIPNGAQSQFVEKEAKLKAEILQWQKKYESLRVGELNNATRNPAKTMDLTKFRSTNGFLSYDTAVELFSSVDLFFNTLDISNPDTDLLFEKVSSIAVSANRIASQATKNGFNDNGYANAVRESATHALTATRYFVIYPTLMPKVIVERAISEVAFAVCDSISALKFSFVSDNEQSITEGKNVSVKSKDLLTDEVNVKPLRITQKLAQNPASRSESEKSHDKIVSSRDQAMASDASQFSPISSRVKDQSSPTPNRGLAKSVAKELVSQSSESNLPLKNYFNSRVEDEAKASDLNHAGKLDSSNEVVNEKAASNYETVDSETKYKDLDSKRPFNSSSPSILDKVKKFEKSDYVQDASTIPVSKKTPLPTKGLESKTVSSPDAQNTPASGEVVNNASPSAPARNKSIFQSLRDRFAPIDSSSSSASSQVQDKEDVKEDDSFEEIDTPSKAKPHGNFPLLKGSGKRSEDLGDLAKKDQGEAKVNAPVSATESEGSETSSSTESSKYATGIAPIASPIGLKHDKINSSESIEQTTLIGDKMTNSVMAGDRKLSGASDKSTKPSSKEHATLSNMISGTGKGAKDELVKTQNEKSPSSSSPVNVKPVVPSVKISIAPSIDMDQESSSDKALTSKIENPLSAEKLLVRDETVGKTQENLQAPLTVGENTSAAIQNSSSDDGKPIKPSTKVVTAPSIDEQAESTVGFSQQESKDHHDSIKRSVQTNNDMEFPAIRKPLETKDEKSFASNIKNTLGSFSSSMKPKSEESFSSVERSLQTENEEHAPSIIEKSADVSTRPLNPEIENSSTTEKSTGLSNKAIGSTIGKSLGSTIGLLKPESENSTTKILENQLKSSSQDGEPVKSIKKTSNSVGEASFDSAKGLSSPSSDNVASSSEQSFQSASKKPILSVTSNTFRPSSNEDASGKNEQATSIEERVVIPERKKPFESYNAKSVLSGEQSHSADKEDSSAPVKVDSTKAKESSVPSSSKKLLTPESDETREISLENKKSEVRSTVSESTGSAGNEKVFLIPNQKTVSEKVEELKNNSDERENSYTKVPSTSRNDDTKHNLPKTLEARDPAATKTPLGLKIKSPSFKVRKVNYQDAVEEQGDSQGYEDAEDDSYDEEEDEARQRQDYRKSMAAATFNFDLFDIDDPDNTVTQVLLYLEHQTVQVISTIQDLLSAIKKPDATRGELRQNSAAISEVIRQMTEATNTSMNQTRNYQLREHGSWVVKSLEDCNHRMNALCKPNKEKDDSEFADRHFKQRLAGISFDIAKCTKELVKTVEEASLKEDIAHLDARLNHPDNLT